MKLFRGLTIIIIVLLLAIGYLYPHAASANLEIGDAQPIPFDRCVVSGCSSELCVKESVGPINTICIFDYETQCLEHAVCEFQESGDCGWTYTEEYYQCIEPPITITTPTPIYSCGNNICEPGEADVINPGGCGPNAPDICLGPPASFKPGTCPEDCKIPPISIAPPPPCPLTVIDGVAKHVCPTIGPAPTLTATPTPLPTKTTDPSPVIFKPLVNYLINELGISGQDIILLKFEHTEFNDSCLGLPEPGENCLQVITPGYIVIFKVPSGELTFHTNETASHFRLVQSFFLSENLISPTPTVTQRTDLDSILSQKLPLESIRKLIELILKDLSNNFFYFLFS